MPGAKKSAPLVRAALTVTLDGYIADPAGGVDWLTPYAKGKDFAALMSSFGVALMGRTTFDHALRIGPPPPTGYRSIVLTSRPLPNPPANYVTFSGDLKQLIEDLRAELATSGKDIWLMGGGQTIQSFLAAGLLDRLELSVTPVLLGSGIPLFPPHKASAQHWTLVKSHPLSSGVIEVYYEPARKSR